PQQLLVDGPPGQAPPAKQPAPCELGPLGAPLIAGREVIAASRSTIFSWPVGGVPQFIRMGHPLRGQPPGEPPPDVWLMGSPVTLGPSGVLLPGQAWGPFLVGLDGSGSP